MLFPIEVPESEITPEITIPPDGIVVPVSTPEPTSLSENPQPLEGDSVDNPQVGTPEPNGDDPGLHLGQTPHSPDTPPGQDSQENTQNNTQGNQDKNKDKNK